MKTLKLDKDTKRVLSRAIQSHCKLIKACIEMTTNKPLLSFMRKDLKLLESLLKIVGVAK